MPRRSLARAFKYQNEVVDKFYLERNGGSNVLQYLERRETGRLLGRSALLERSVSLTYLVRILVIPYKCCDLWDAGCCIVKRAEKLIGRELESLEISELIRLMRFGFSNQEMNFLDIDRESHGIVNYNILPLTFIELLEVIYRRGCNMNCVDKQGSGFLWTTIFHCYNQESHIKQIVKFLIKHKIDVNNPDLLKEISCCMTDLNDDAVDIFELLINHRTHNRGVAASNPFIIFIRKLHYRFLFYSNTMKVIRLFIRHGYFCNEVLKEFCSIDTYGACFLSPRSLRIAYAVFNVLIEATPDLQNLPHEVTSSLLWRVFHPISDSRKIPTFSDLLEALLDRTYDLPNRNSFLLTICRCYNCEDLPVTVKRLLQNGFDVNYIGKNNHNALFSLFMNFPCHRNNVHETIVILIEGGIDINYIGSFGDNALMKFIFTGSLSTRCCRYKKLLKLNRTKYWDTILMLLDVGCSVLHRSFNKMNMFTIFFQAFAHRISSICSECALSHFGLVRTDGAIGVPGLEHFTPFLDVLERIILKAGAGFKGLSCENDFNMLLFVCSCFKGQELVALVRLLCRYGVDVNATCYKPPDSFLSWLSNTPLEPISYPKPMNAIEIIRLENSSELGQLELISSVLKQYGFQNDV